MKAIVFSYTRRGAELSLRVRNCLRIMGYDAEAHTSDKFIGTDASLQQSQAFLLSAEQAFKENKVIVYIGSCGIAVRAIAPHIKSKQVDPAVISIDERGKYVIPLLAGHIGGANEIARKIADSIAAQPIITTATDINGLFAVDEWAARNNISICNMSAAKEVSAALVDGKTVGFVSTYPVSGNLPIGIEQNRNCKVGIVIDKNEEMKAFSVTLNLIPKIFHLGIGCRRGTKLGKIEDLVLPQLDEMQISLQAVGGIASVDLKKNEEGLLAFAEKYHLPIRFYSAEELASQNGDFSKSAFVQSVVGVSNVCERSAVADSNGGRLILSKTPKDGVTLAIAQKEWQIDFDEK